VLDDAGSSFGGADGLLVRLIVKHRLTKSSGSTSLDAEFDRDFIAPDLAAGGDERPFFSASTLLAPLSLGSIAKLQKRARQRRLRLLLPGISLARARCNAVLFSRKPSL
jgi:hypothetical protein